jgi:threonine dehydrogenase-like Zn-dependent dehydrogenase
MPAVGGTKDGDGWASDIMRAAFFEGYRAITVRDAPVPEPGPAEVRVRVVCCGICGSDLSLYKTGALAGPDVVLGHEISAIVDVDPSGEWAPGARVTVFPSGTGCGTCVWCREGRPRYCLNPTGRPHGGGFADYVVVAKEDLIALPDSVNDQAGTLTEPFGVAVRGVMMAAPVGGDLAYVSGLGSIGLLSVAALLASGCRVIGGDPREDRQAAALVLGAEAVFDPSKEDPGLRMMTVDPHGPRIAFECAGVPDSLQQIFDACGPMGTVGILGIPMAPVFLLRMTMREQRAFSIQGPSRESMLRALALLQQKPDIAAIITGTVPLEQADAAFAGLVEGDGGIKVLVTPGA